MEASFSWQEISLFVAGIVTFISAIINIFVVRGQSKKQRTAEIITNNRVEWMQELKKWTSEYISYIEYNYNKTSPEDIDKYLKDVLEISTRINLHLNLKGKQDREIIDKIKELNKSLEEILKLTEKRSLDQGNVNSDELNQKIKKTREDSNSLLRLVKIYLKVEWERVKVEARYGVFSKFDFDSEYKKTRDEVENDTGASKNEKELILEESGSKKNNKTNEEEGDKSINKYIDYNKTIEEIINNDRIWDNEIKLKDRIKNLKNRIKNKKTHDNKSKNLNSEIIKSLKDELRKIEPLHLNRILLISEDMKEEESQYLQSFSSFTAICLSIVAIFAATDKDEDKKITIIVFLIYGTFIIGRAIRDVCFKIPKLRNLNKKLKSIEITIKEILDK